MRKNLIIWMLSGIFGLLQAGNTTASSLPKMKPVKKVIYLAISNDSPEAKHICRVFQGIINRDSAEIFLANDNKELEWFKYLNVPYGRPSQIINSGSNQGLRTLFRNYKDRLDKLVVCNFANDDYTFNMAVNMACVENALPVSESLKNSLVSEFGWNKEIVDIRNQWSNITEAYDWALKNLMPQINKQIAFSVGLRDDWRNGGWAIYDYAVASRSFCFWVNDETAAGKVIIKKILNTPGYPKNSYVLGYGMHGDDLNLTINPEGFGFLVSDLFPNGSYYSSFPSQTFPVKPNTALTAGSGKVYVALHWSDGDNIQFNHNASRDIFNQKDRGSVPVSMTLSPALVDIAPFILKYYYENATENDEFIGGPSGVQYIQEPYYKPEDYNSWCVMNGEWLEKAGMNTTASSLRWPAQAFYNNGFTQTNVTGTLAWTSGSYKDAYYWNGMPVVCTGGVVATEQNLYNYLVSVQSSDNYPVFTGVYMVQAGFGSAGYPAIKRVFERLNTEFPGKYVFQKAGDLMATAKKYFESTQAPFKQHTIPGRIEAEDFDLGGQGAGFYDHAKKNEGGAYRNAKSDYAGIGGGASEYFVGWTDTGEWLNYTVDVAEEGVYDLKMNYSTPSSGSKGICILLDNNTLASVELEGTGGNNRYENQTVKVNLEAGKHNLKIQFTSSGMNLDYIEFTKKQEIIPEIKGDKIYKLVVKQSGKCLALQQNNQLSGTNIVQQSFNTGKHQCWKIKVAGEACYTLESVYSGLFITSRGTGNLQQYPFDCIADNGKWILDYQGDELFAIHPKKSVKAIGIPNNQTDENVLLTVLDNTGTDNQLFYIEEVDSNLSIDESMDMKHNLAPYPNPFSSHIIIPLYCHQPETVDFRIYNFSGALVYQSYKSIQAGLNRLEWNAPDMAPGLYLYQIKSKYQNINGRILKVR